VIFSVNEVVGITDDSKVVDCGEIEVVVLAISVVL
jgi:hypothetical protein